MQQIVCSTAGRIFTKSSLKNVFAVLLVNGGTRTKFAPPPKKIIVAKNVHFWSEHSDSAVFGGIREKLKHLV